MECVSTCVAQDLVVNHIFKGWAKELEFCFVSFVNVVKKRINLHEISCWQSYERNAYGKS